MLSRLALLAIAVVLYASPARADDGFLPFQIPHWTNIQSMETDEIAVNSEKQQTRPAAKITTPEKPLTPHDYEALLSAMAPALSNAGPQSPLEELYSDRIVDQVSQFGYDLFGSPENFASKNDHTLPAGAVQDHFVLSIGDKLNIIFRGQRNQQGIYSITSEGLLVVEDLPNSGRRTHYRAIAHSVRDHRIRTA